MRIIYLPHARRRMRERDVSEDEARATLEEPDVEYPQQSRAHRGGEDVPREEASNQGGLQSRCRGRARGGDRRAWQAYRRR